MGSVKDVIVRHLCHPSHNKIVGCYFRRQYYHRHWLLLSLSLRKSTACLCLCNCTECNVWTAFMAVTGVIRAALSYVKVVTIARTIVSNTLLKERTKKTKNKNVINSSKPSMIAGLFGTRWIYTKLALEKRRTIASSSSNKIRKWSEWHGLCFQVNFAYQSGINSSHNIHCRGMQVNACVCVCEPSHSIGANSHWLGRTKTCSSFRCTCQVFTVGSIEDGNSLPVSHIQNWALASFVRYYYKKWCRFTAALLFHLFDTSWLL